MGSKEENDSSQEPESEREEKNREVNNEELDETREQVKALEQEKKKTEKELAAANKSLKDVRAELKEERQTKDKTVKQLEKAENSLSEVEEKYRLERQAHAESEKELAEVKKIIAGDQEETDISSSAFVESSGAEHTDTFVVRLAVNDQGQPLRTVIQHVRTKEKKSFPALDLQQLGRFIRTQLLPQSKLEPSVQSAHATESMEASEEKPIYLTDTMTKLHGPKKLISGSATSEESFEVEVSFRLDGTEITPYVREQHDYQIKVMAANVSTGEVKNLASRRGKLQENVFNYTNQLQISDLSPGLFKLLTTITIRAPSPLGSFYEGPIINLTQQKQFSEVESV